ncbi:hypothetical protein MXB_5226, partial [Myxobolus squamalis]
MIDLNKGNVIRVYETEKTNFFNPYNTIELDRKNNLILFKGDLYCTRSGKLVFSFEKFNPCISGIFTSSDFEVIINSEHLKRFSFVKFGLFLINSTEKIEFASELNCSDISRDCTKILICKKYTLPSPNLSSILIINIGPEHNVN